VTRDEGYMRLALEEADSAALEGEVPIGCVLVSSDDAVLARGHNLREQRRDATAHAEVVALRRAGKTSVSWRLEGATAYVTLEPCIMCAGAFLHARVARVVYACDDPKGGAAHSLYALGSDRRLNHQYELTRGILSDEATVRLRSFFAKLRRSGKK